jgi:3-deoxy-manno-octulosonate cytidylyltransferase (CMP-KDO synthetase)
MDVVGVLTRRAHPSGTHRVAEVADLPRFQRADTVLNVQGDLPHVRRDVALAALGRLVGGDPIGTVGVPLSLEALGDRGRVKVAVDRASGRALRFSRSVPASVAWPCDVDVLEHVGLYAYTRQALRRWVQLPADPEEQSEGLEQVRPLAHGIPVGVARWMGPAPVSIDTERDLLQAQAGMTLVGHGGSG